LQQRIFANNLSMFVNVPHQKSNLYWQMNRVDIFRKQGLE
jgi:hypothetical protein